MNRIRLRARLVARDTMRYTPAGLPAIDARFRHSGSVTEAGTERTLDFEFDALALGPVAERLSALPLDAETELDGFVAPRSRRGTRLVVHINEYTRITGV